MQCDSAGLDVGSGAHFLGGADEHRDLAAVAVIEQAQLVFGFFGVVDEADLLGGHPPGDQVVADSAVHVEVVLFLAAFAGGAAVAEDDLQPAGCGHVVTVLGVFVDRVGVLLVHGHDVLSDCGGPRVGWFGQVDHARVETGFAAIVGDFQDVVAGKVFRIESAGSVAEVGDEVPKGLVGGDADDGALAVVAEFGQFQADLVAGDDIGEDRRDTQQLLEVAEFSDSGDWLELCAGRVDFDGVDGGGERRCPVVDVQHSGVFEQVGA